MTYPSLPNFNQLVEQISLYTQLKHEYGASGMEPILAVAEKALSSALEALKALPMDENLARQEPNELKAIQELRPAGPRRIWHSLDREQYQEKLAGALLGRMAGCTLGAPVEFWPVERMESLARETGNPFPPQDYWTYVPDPYNLRYALSPVESYTRDKMDGVPVDDDLAYTLLGLLIMEDYGPGFTTEDVGKGWLKYLPYACTAEDVALRNLKAGVPALQAADVDNPFCEWIGADIRSDPWGYLAPGWPEKAAELAYRDAYLSHRRQGIYGEMFFSAAISAAFTVQHPIEALEIGLTEIPRDCALAKAVRWALEVAGKPESQIKDYRQARAMMEERFAGMSGVHTINNACLTVWGLTIGGTDFTRVIGETVAMGLDNDCTAATAGSIAGAIVGKAGIPAHWYRNFNNTIHSYLSEVPFHIDHRKFSIDDLTERFTRQASRLFPTG
jgi:ADP-ribosylglycohydrolase